MTATALAPRGASGARHEIPTTRCIRTLPALERELSDGVLRSWKTLVRADPLASPFQSPGWCVPWYRAYHDEFDPFVVAVMEAGTLVGVVPLTVHRSTNEIGFASGTMADYRDIVALPGARALVVDELLRVYLEGRFPNPLQIGWIDPLSDTPSLVANACRARGVRFVSWQQPCYRWAPVEGENLNKKFSRVRTHLNGLKRLGNVTFEVVTGADGWAAFRDPFFEQHSLRQLQADREVSFDDPRKGRFYDRLFDSSAVQTHVTALRLDGELLSGHIGLVWRDVLMLGAPSISIEHEGRSPALILLSWVMQNATSLGLKGFDLTIGDTEFKRRLGNRCVRVTAIEVYGSRVSYYAHLARREATAIAKGLAAAALGRDAWGRRVRPTLHRLARHVAVARDRGLRAAIRSALQTQTGRGPEERTVTPRDVPLLDATVESSSFDLRQNRIQDLLLWRGPDASTARAIRTCARSYSRRRAAGETLHTLVRGGRLAAWCYSSHSAGDAVVADLHIPYSRTAAADEAALVSLVARQAFAAGALRVRLTGE